MFAKLSRRNQLIILAIALGLCLVYVTPIWHIRLTAPQYRNGLSMSIWVNKITGGGEFDLQNINLLNHYIGMKPIHAEMFREFGIMPYVLAFMIFGALVTAALPRLGLVYLGIANFFVTAVAGLYDFWKWEYEYGHNLDTEAAIQIPGMFYQPPLLACKQLMNFTACSWPHVGAIILFASGGILAYIAYDERKQKKAQSQT